MKKNGMRPVPPGEILNEEFLKPLGLTANALAKAIGVPPNRITAILKDERGITGDTAIRLGTFFKTSAEFWMNLQMTYDLRNAEKALPARVRKRRRVAFIGVPPGFIIRARFTIRRSIRLSGRSLRKPTVRRSSSRS